MTTSVDPNHPGPPTVREIAALTARLREISARGRDVDAAQRVAFLADKDALIDRIIDTTGVADSHATVVPPAETADTNVDIAGRVDAQFLIEVDRFDHDGIVHVVDDIPIEHDGRLTVPTRAGDDATWVELPAGQWVTLADTAVADELIPEMPERVTDDTDRAAASDADEAADLGAPVRDDPTWWAPTGPDEVALSRQEVAAELAGRGFTPDQARAAVAEYLDETSARIGISVHQWAMDSHDVEAIAYTRRPPVPVPEQRHPTAAEKAATADQTSGRGAALPDDAGERDGWEQVRDGDPRSYEQMMSDAAGALTTHRPADVEGERRERLVRWHTDDTAAGSDRGVGDVIDDGTDEPVIFEGRPW
ncbi:MAG: hypothetical protein J0I49_33185 [Pseudonocardia sp.]|uniref:hypothetical protein n=1 Tax=Pseudonocardia sp. TaxID=60912 RepID=UPI001ACCF4BE|nr:hypothetical protein [Pseudonocardia sp.]MBN9102912.1 hypothetical protein [Pseudonocardia sp.]